MYELGNKRMKLQLDSGTPSFLLFSKVNKVDFISRNSLPHSIGGIFGGGFDAEPAQTDLRLGNRLFPKLTVLVPTDNMPPMDVDGLLPTSLFQSIFISHSGQFAILNPSTKPALASGARSATASLEGRCSEFADRERSSVREIVSTARSELYRGVPVMFIPLKEIDRVDNSP
jgi:hypothetical protein